MADQALRFTRRRSTLRKGVSRLSTKGWEQPERRQVRIVTAAKLRISAETAKRFALIITTLTFLAILKRPILRYFSLHFQGKRNDYYGRCESGSNARFSLRQATRDGIRKTCVALSLQMKALSLRMKAAQLRFAAKMQT